MRIRTIKPEFWTDSFMVGLPPFARLVFLGLLSVADDHGFFEDELDRVAMQIMPREDVLEVLSCIDLFLAAERLEKFVNKDGKGYYRIANWEKHQRVDRPSNSKLTREGSRKLAIPHATRRKVAQKYNCKPGGETGAKCYYCEAAGSIKWWPLSNGKPSGWVSFSNLELDHLFPESAGGSYSDDNIVLACQNCNRSKGVGDWIDFLSSRTLANTREESRVLPVGKEGIRDQGKDQGSGTKVEAPLPFAGDAFASAWADWLKYRKEIKHPIKPETAKAMHAKFTEWGEDRSIAAIRHTIFKGWRGLVEPDVPAVVTVPGANKHQMPAATAADHGKGFLFETGIKPREGGQL